jgi:uncharacterized protein (TIGR03083 family)
MDDARIWGHIDEQRADLADLLDTLSDAQWATPSLCPGWTVRNVAAHLTQANASWGRMALEAFRSGFRFNAMMSRAAREDRRSPQEIVTNIRAMVGQRRRPPGTAVADPLMDTLVHGQDIAVPLGITRTMPVDAALIAAERLWAMRFPFNAQRRFAGVHFTATDAPFTVGDGRRVDGPIQDIVLVLAGRRVGIDGLTGHTEALALG